MVFALSSFELFGTVYVLTLKLVQSTTWMSETSDSEDVSNRSEFHTPQQQAAAQDRENWSEWDEYEDPPSFLGGDGYEPSAESSPELGDPRHPPPRVDPVIRRPFVLASDPTAPLAAWPPRKLSSEPPQADLHSDAIPLPQLDDTVRQEDFEDDVFNVDRSSEGEGEVTMPGPGDHDAHAPQPPTLQELYTQLLTAHRSWNKEVQKINARQVLSKTLWSELTDDFKEMRALYRQASKTAGFDGDNEKKFDDVMAALDCDLVSMERILDGGDQGAPANVQNAGAAPPEVDPDIAVEVSVNRALSMFENLNKRVVPAIENVNNLLGDGPEPSHALTRKVSKQRSDAEEILKENNDLDKKAMQEIICFNNAARKKDAEEKLRFRFDFIKKEVAKITDPCDVYLDELPPPEAAHLNPPPPPPAARNNTAARLERLPLPRYSGNKTDYLHFKGQFLTHVKYEDEADKVLALQEKCLPEKIKAKISKETTLAGCWKKLDSDYGGENALVREVTAQLRQLKTPQNDAMMISFVDKVENLVNCLKSIASGAMYLPTAGIIIEEKLEKSLQDVYTRELQKEEIETSHDFLFEFLAREKAAANSRKSLNINKDENKVDPPKKEKVKKTTDEVQANSTNVRDDDRSQRGGGFRGGRGQRGRGSNNRQNNRQNSSNDKPSRGRGNNRGRGGKSRSDKTKTCMACEGDHQTSRCDTWRDEETDKRELLLLATHTLPEKLCEYCLEPYHSRWKCYSEDENLGCPCGSGVNLYICCKTEECRTRANWLKTRGNTTSVKSSAAAVNGAKIGSTLNPIVMVRVANSESQLRVMWDNCSQSTFIRNSVAKKLKLKGEPISFILVCTDGTEKKTTGMKYQVVLIDKERNRHEIEAIGLETISNVYSGARLLKPLVVYDEGRHKTLNNCDLQRTSGTLDILAGTDIASLHPHSHYSIDNLVIMKTIFGSGWTVMGHNSALIKISNPKMKFHVNVCQVKNIRSTASNIVGVKTKDLQFLEAVSTESVGVGTVPKCRTCKIRSDKCPECHLITNNTTYLEYLQDLQIAENIKKIEGEDGYIASYPYNNEVSLLLPNEEICRKRTETMENNLKKVPADLADINAKIEESFNNGVFRYLSQKELDEWDGPVHYLPMNVNYKDSLSTPIRLCFDSSQPDKNGRSLNSVMGKGRNPINNFGTVIINFRAAEQVASGDISKMFNRIKVQPQDMHLRRFLVRPDGLGGKEEWKVAVATVVNFGETAAPAVATSVKNRAAEDNKHISEEVSRMIKKDCIMDDINISAKYDEDLDKNIQKAEQILAPGNFKFKKWIKSNEGDGEKEIKSSDLSKSLGLHWHTGKDVLVYRIKLNFSKKKRNRYSQPDTISSTLHDDFPELMTKRLALKLNHSVFDPARLLQPWMMKPRLAFRDILFYEKENNISGWDIPLPDKFRDQWLKITEEMFALESLEFPRSIVPRDYNKDVKPALVMFSDGADLGQCAVAYLVWELNDGSVHVSLVTSVTKIASMNKISTPKSELVAAQLQSRLRSWLVKNLDINIGDVFHIVDASIVIGMIKNCSLKFDTFTAPRVTEIQMNTEANEWRWIDTSQNPSDLGTRGKCTVADLDKGGIWREGPDWLRLPRAEWPLRSDFRRQEVPGLKKEFEILPSISNVTQLIQVCEEIEKQEKEAEKIKVNTIATSEEHSFVNDVNISKYNCLFDLLAAAGNLLKAKYKFRKEEVPHRADLMKEAKKILLQSMMTETKEMLKKTKLDGLLVYEKDGLMFATTRNKQENQNPDDLVILSPKHPITNKILYSFHNINHRGVQHCVARSRIFYWIPQAAKLMKRIKNSCYTCRIRDAEAMKQLMAPLPRIRLKPSPVWYYSMVDLLGPIQVTNFINQRTTRKTWAVIITCLTTRACWVYLAESFSTDHLLTVLRKHESRNGSPANYYADLGRQIVGADRVLSEALSDVDKEEVRKFSAGRGTKFIFGTPHFPEGQGAVERLVQEVKKNLKVITKKCLTFGELDTLLSEASYLVNSRPLQPNPSLGEDSFICPNDILFGRSDKEPPASDVSDTAMTRKAAMKQRIVAEFWNKWSSSYYQTLVGYAKWRYKDRNAQVGDVVLILDKEIEKGKFTSGIIDTVKTDPDKVVRKVTVKYKLKQKKDPKDPMKFLPLVYKYCERNVRGLALIMTKEERNQIENIDLDELRFRFPRRSEKKKNNNSNNEEEADQNIPDVNDDDDEINSEDDREVVSEETNEVVPSPNRNKHLKEITPSSTGRLRWKPDKYN